MESKKIHNGSMTVFFALIFMLIFALVGTTIELARFHLCRGHAYRTLKLAEEGLFTEYNRPLFDEYNLFFLEREGTPFEVSVLEYAAPTLNADADREYVDLFDGAMVGASVRETTYIGDNGATPLKKEINDYMMRRLPKDAFDKLMKKKSVVDVDKDAANIEKKVEEEREAAELDLGRLELMRLVDGIDISEGGGLGGEKVFVKMFLTGAKKPQALGISHRTVWDIIKGHTVSVADLIEEATEDKRGFLSYVEKCIEVIKKAIHIAGNFAEKSGKMSSVLKGNQKVLEETKELLEGEEGKLLGDKLTSLWKAYDTTSISFDYTGLSEKGGGDNPRDGLSKALNTGILKIILEKPSRVSRKSVKNPDGFCQLYKTLPEEASDYEKQVEGFVKEEEAGWNNLLGSTIGYRLEEFCLDRYIEEFCGRMQANEAHEKRTKSEKALDYECEYILSGKKSDEENLKSVASRLLLTRTVTNFGTIFSNSKYRNAAYASAATIVGFTGMEFLIRLTQTLIILAWSMTEGLVDVAALFQGREVPVIKSSRDILISLPDLFGISHGMIQTKAKQVKRRGVSMKYEEYLTVFMTLMNDSVKSYRLMDLIQWNMAKNHGKNFSLSTMVYSIQMQGEFEFKTKFLRFPVLENILNRKQYSFHVTARASTSY